MDNSNPTPLTPNSDVPIKPIPNKNHKIIFFEIIFGIICLVLAGYIILQNTENSANLRREVKDIQIPSSETSKGNFEVLAKPNSKDNLLSDIYLKDEKTGKEEFFITLSGVERNDYYIGEFHNGNLYIVTSTGANNAYMKNPKWTDTLWRYNSKKEGEKIYTVQGIDFRVRHDEKYIVVLTNNYLKILNRQGKELKTFYPKELQAVSNDLPIGNFLLLEGNVLWFSNTFGPTLAGLVEINLESFKIERYNLRNLHSGIEFEINPERKLLVYSTYPAIFDVDGAEEYKKSG